MDQVWVVCAHPHHTFSAQSVVFYRVVHPLEYGEWEGNSTPSQVGIQLILVQGGCKVMGQVVGYY